MERARAPGDSRAAGLGDQSPGNGHWCYPEVLGAWVLWQGWLSPLYSPNGALPIPSAAIRAPLRGPSASPRGR